MTLFQRPRGHLQAQESALSAGVAFGSLKSKRGKSDPRDTHAEVSTAAKLVGARNVLPSGVASKKAIFQSTKSE